MYKQKTNTGIAILNQPCGALGSDPKIQGAYRLESIRVGEIHAVACLAAELHVLQLAGIEQKKWNQHLDVDNTLNSPGGRLHMVNHLRVNLYVSMVHSGHRCMASSIE